MITNIIQTTTNILTKNYELISKSEVEGYILIPEAGKALKNKFTGEVFASKIYIYNSNKLKDFIEVDLPKEE